MPPIIPIQSISVPVAMYVAKHDEIADYKDNLEVKSLIPNVINF